MFTIDEKSDRCGPISEPVYAHSRSDAAASFPGANGSTAGRITQLTQANNPHTHSIWPIGDVGSSGYLTASSGLVQTVHSDGEAAQRPVTPTQVLDSHLAGLRWSMECAHRDVAHIQAQLDQALVTREATVKAVAAFEAELAKR